jgi:hypothetical protein
MLYFGTFFPVLVCCIKQNKSGNPVPNPMNVLPIRKYAKTFEKKSRFQKRLSRQPRFFLKSWMTNYWAKEQ